MIVQSYNRAGNPTLAPRMVLKVSKAECEERAAADRLVFLSKEIRFDHTPDELPTRYPRQPASESRHHQASPPIERHRS
jgi:hypothetical protein